MQQLFRNYSLELEHPGSRASTLFHFGSQRRNRELTALIRMDLSSSSTGYARMSPQYFAHNAIELMTKWPIPST
jgi:hypothetical protein